MPGDVWDGTQNRRIAYLWAWDGSNQRVVLKAWVWDGTQARLWYDWAGGLPTLYEGKDWFHFLSFTDTESVHKTHLKDEDPDTMLMYLHINMNPEERDRLKTRFDYISLTDVESLFKKIWQDDTDTFPLAEAWAESQMMKPLQGKEASHTLSFSDLESLFKKIWQDDTDTFPLAEAWAESQMMKPMADNAAYHSLSFADSEGLSINYLGPSGDPSDFTATDLSSCVLGYSTPNYVVELFWTNGDSSAQTRIYREGTLIRTEDAGVRLYQDNSPITGRESYYDICHYKNGYESDRVRAYVTVDALTCGPTATPTISVVDASSCSSCSPTYGLAVTVDRGGDTISSLYVDRRVNGGSWTLGYSTSASFTDTSITVGNTYEYRARLVYNSVTTTSSTDGETVVNPCTTPSVPTFTLSCPSVGTVRISGVVVPSGGLVRVYRSPNYGSGQHIGTITNPDSSYDDTGRSDNTQYCYKLEAVNDGDCSSGLSSEQCITTWPSTPMNLSGSGSTSDVDFTWDVGTRTSEALQLEVYDTVGLGWDIIASPSAGTEEYLNWVPAAKYLGGPSNDEIQARIKFSSSGYDYDTFIVGT